MLPHALFCFFNTIRMTTDAKAIVFSLPVTGTAGMRLMEEEPEE